MGSRPDALGEIGSDLLSHFHFQVQRIGRCSVEARNRDVGLFRHVNQMPFEAPSATLYDLLSDEAQ
jgi:hypothetical protein